MELFTVPVSHACAKEFTRFPLLPAEIRNKIWLSALQVQRVIKIVLADSSDSRLFGNNNEQNCAYHVGVEGRTAFSRILQVNMEARQTALKFYHIRIPCKWFKAGLCDSISGEPSDPAKPATLYINPIYDMLHIDKCCLDNPLILGDFLNEIHATYDLQHIGLLGLALASDFVGQQWARRLDSNDTERINKLATSVARLREVLFVNETSHGRQISGLATLTSHVFNRSYPIMPKTPTFQRLERDPRNITADLKRITVWSFDPRRDIGFWLQLLEHVHIASDHIDYKVLLTSKPARGHENIYDTKTAETWLRKEQDTWKHINETIPMGPSAAESLISFYGGDSIEPVQPAFGFWLFPLDIITEIPTDKQSSEAFMIDLTNHWPELWLSDLS